MSGGDSAGVIEVPFGGVSLAELRSAVLAEREIEVVPLATLPTWSEPSSSEAPSFDELIAMVPAAAAHETWEDDEEAYPRRGKGRLALIAAAGLVVPLVLGGLVFLGLVWTTSGVSAPPEWLPEQLWFGPWAGAVSK